MFEQFLSRQQNLEATRAELTSKLASTRSALDDLTADMTIPRAASELVTLTRDVSDLTAAITRVDAALEAVDRQLSTAQAAQRRAELLDTIRDAAEAAQEATAEEQREYDALAVELEAVLDRFIAARTDGNRTRTHLRALLKNQTPALGALFYWGAVTPAQEAAAQRLDAALRDRGIDVADALNANAELPYGAPLAALLESHQRDNSRKLLEVV